MRYFYTRLFDDHSGETQPFETEAEALAAYENDLDFPDHLVFILIFDNQNAYALRFQQFTRLLDQPEPVYSPAISNKSVIEI